MTEIDLKLLSAWFPHHMCMFLRKAYEGDYAGAEEELIEESTRLSYVPFGRQEVSSFPKEYWMKLYCWLQEHDMAGDILFGSYVDELDERKECVPLYYKERDVLNLLDLFDEYFFELEKMN